MGVISVCMPYYQRQALLDQSLAAYRAHYGDIEISICDDGSPDPVKAPGCVVTTLPRKLGALNPCVPINRAVEAASGDVLVLTNPEIEHRTPILDAMLEDLEALGPKGYVTASCYDDRGIWIAHSSIKPFENGRGYMPAGSQFHFCAMFYRSLWDEAGGFDEDYREGSHFDDNDWLMRLERAEAKFKHRDDLITYHHPTGTSWPEGGWQRNAVLFARKWLNGSQ